MDVHFSLGICELLGALVDVLTVVRSGHLLP